MLVVAKATRKVVHFPQKWYPKIYVMSENFRIYQGMVLPHKLQEWLKAWNQFAISPHLEISSINALPLLAYLLFTF